MLPGFPGEHFLAFSAFSRYTEHIKPIEKGLISVKKLIALVLCIATAASCIACTAAEEETFPTVEKKDYSEHAGIVEDSITWYENFQNLPVANADMTTDELRQLCVDAFKANLTFQWTPNQNIKYTYTLLEKSRDVQLPTGIAYAGLCYCTGIRDATFGTLYKALSFYDKETGVLDIAAMGDNALGIISSACAYGAQQGWNRVSNSHKLQGMESYNRFDSNIVPVGPYTYEQFHYNYQFVARDASSRIIAANGDQVMLESFAQMLPGDGLFSSPSWHVMMCSITPVVVRNPDGTVNGDESYLHVCEQETSGTVSDQHNVMQSNGVPLRPLGKVDNKYTLSQLLQKGYIPFTIKEFLGEDPVEPGKAWLGTETVPIENGQDLTISQLFGKALFTNYALCNLELTVKTPEGKELFSYDPMIVTSPKTYNVMLSEITSLAKLEPYANGKNTIHIYAQLANGELVEAYKTILKAD